MSFNECDKVIGGSLFVSLVDDGDQLVVIFVGEPMPREELYCGKKRSRAYFPVMAEDGLHVFGANAKTYRYLRDNWKSIANRSMVIIRNGVKGSSKTTYEIKAKKLSPAEMKRWDKVTPKEVKALMADLVEFSSQDGDGILF